MLSRPVSLIADECSRRASYLSGYVLRMDARCKSVADRNQVYAGAYVSYLAFFESRLEKLFVALCTGSHAHPSAEVKPVLKFPSARVAKSMIFASRQYADWLPYDQHTLKRAPTFLAGGAPFTALNSSRRAALNKASVLRNALAHASDHSLRRFQTEFVDGRSLPPGQRTPAGYLRGAHSLTHNRFEIQMMELVAVMVELCT